MSLSTRIADVVEYVQDHLDRPLHLEALARRGGRSPHHFHRAFRASVGEPPAAHVRRLRLERAALWLVTTDLPVCQVAFAVGYETHEAFTRAFTVAFGASPRSYRAERSRTGMATSGSFEIVERPAVRMAYVRYVGPYDGSPSAFDRVAPWAARQGLCDETRIIAYRDDQRITSPEHTRCDVGVIVPSDGPVRGDGEVRIRQLRGGPHAAIRYAGPYEADTARGLYDELIQSVLRSRRWRPSMAPPFELYPEGMAAWIHLPLSAL